MGRLTTPLILAAAILGAALVPNVAAARKQTDYRYHYEQVWSAALRLVRVDLRYHIEDQNPNVGYVLFDYEDRGRQHHGSIELVRTEVEGVTYVRAVVQISTMPSYVEQMLLDRLERKLRAEFGDPPAAPRRRPSDGDDDDDDDDDDGRGDHDSDAGADRGRGGQNDGNARR